MNILAKTNVTWIYIGCISVGCSLKLIPSQYKNKLRNTEEGIDGGKLPVCSWTSDPYINWLTQNGANLAIQTTLGIAKTIAGATISIASGGTASAIGVMAGLSGVSDITQALHQVHENYIQPDQAHSGSNQGEFNFADGFGFGVQRKSIKAEYAKIIDDYFTMFGYKVNSVKIPNITGRLNWNYVKTINSNILGEIPQEDLQEIKDIFNNGVTLWHNPLTFLDYSQNNNIV